MEVIIVNYRTPQLVLDCLRSLSDERRTVVDLSVTVVDNASNDGSAPTLASALAGSELAGWVKLVALPINGGFGWANNQAILGLLKAERRPEFFHLLNPDTRAGPGSIGALVSEMRKHPDCGAVGSLLVAPDGRSTGSAFRFPSVGREFARGAQIALIAHFLGIDGTVIDSEVPTEADWVTGASVLLRGSALKDVGLFDDGFFLYFEEVELMWRMRRAGWTVRHQPKSIVLHVGGASTGVEYEDMRKPKSRMPRYYFESRRRYFALTSGSATSVLAALSWLLAAPIGLARSWITGQPERRTNFEVRDQLRWGVLPKAFDRVPAIPTWSSPPDVPPAWLRWQ